jgi:hypothetical protein
MVTHEVNGSESLKRVITELMPRIETWLGAEDLGALEKAVGEFTAGGGRVDLLKYVASVERTSVRVGLLLAGDVGAAVALAKENMFGGGYRDALSVEERRTPEP